MRVLIAAGVAGVALAGCSSGGAAKPPPAAVSGYIIPGDYAFSPKQIGHRCASLDYPDVAKGAPVTVSDDSGRTLAILRLGGGTYNPDGSCEFRFSGKVEGGGKFYEVEVSNRGATKVSAAGLRHVALTLG